jgi:hypothetical protein
LYNPVETAHLPLSYIILEEAPLFPFVFLTCLLSHNCSYSRENIDTYFRTNHSAGFVRFSYLLLETPCLAKKGNL